MIGWDGSMKVSPTQMNCAKTHRRNFRPTLHNGQVGTTSHPSRMNLEEPSNYMSKLFRQTHMITWSPRQDVRVVVVVQSSLKSKSSPVINLEPTKQVACINPLFATHKSVARHRFVPMHASAPRTPLVEQPNRVVQMASPSPMLSLFFPPANYSACATLKANSNLSIVVAKANQKYWACLRSKVVESG
jgi:hypothetical protein